MYSVTRLDQSVRKFFNRNNEAAQNSGSIDLSRQLQPFQITTLYSSHHLSAGIIIS